MSYPPKRSPAPRGRADFADHAAQGQTDEQTIIPTWSEGDNIIVTTAPEPTADAMDEQTRKINRILLQRAWDDYSRPDQIQTARTLAAGNACIAAAAALGGFTFYTTIPTPDEIAHKAAFQQQVVDNEAKKSRLKDAYYSVADLNTTLHNTAQVVIDVRATPEGNACWKKYTSAQTDSGTIQTATLHKCLGDEFSPFLIDPNPDYHNDTVVGAVFTVIALVGAVLTKFGTKQISADIRHQRDLIVNNPEYNGQPLPGPFKIKQPALTFDKD
ncbi:hypothetical protein [Micavibrio aeruginosavorus]|uniref:Transmembrane protein n=1 Tax=Micavibrio aeruginosavorus EPB TaxID=349215 RepID=M4VBR9_9BACT|nr:hypothetical protein [Micavibrio aeruginosavorus]AGH96852.1 hypothetical protein A11S_14 [Micavibrio aeruginosavorus EPB]